MHKTIESNDDEEEREEEEEAINIFFRFSPLNLTKSLRFGAPPKPSNRNCFLIHQIISFIVLRSAILRGLEPAERIQRPRRARVVSLRAVVEDRTEERRDSGRGKILTP